MSKHNRIGPPGANWWDKKKPVKDKSKTRWHFDSAIDDFTIDIRPTHHIAVGDSMAAPDGTVFRVIKKTATSITLAPTGHSIGRSAAAML